MNGHHSRDDRSGALRDECRARIKQKMLEDVTGEGVMRLEEAISSWEVRPEPSRRREAEEQLGGDVVRARLQNPQGVVRTAEEARPQPREELEAAVDSICKHVKELGTLHVAESDVGECFACQDVRRSWGAHSASSQVRLWTCGMDWHLASAAGRQECWKTLHAERRELVIGSPPSRRHSPWIKDEREARLQGINT